MIIKKKLSLKLLQNNHYKVQEYKTNLYTMEILSLFLILHVYQYVTFIPFFIHLYDLSIRAHSSTFLTHDMSLVKNNNARIKIIIICKN